MARKKTTRSDGNAANSKTAKKNASGPPAGKKASSKRQGAKDAKKIDKEKKATAETAGRTDAAIVSGQGAEDSASPPNAVDSSGGRPEVITSATSGPRALERKVLWLGAVVATLALLLACVALFRPPRVESVSESGLEQRIASLEAEIAAWRPAVEYEPAREPKQPSAAAFDQAQVIAMLRRLVRAGDDAESTLESDQLFDAIRDHPEFPQLLADLPSATGDSLAAAPSTAVEEAAHPATVAANSEPLPADPVTSETPDVGAADTATDESPRSLPPENRLAMLDPHEQPPRELPVTAEAGDDGPMGPAQLVAGRKEREQLWQRVQAFRQEQDWPHAREAAERVVEWDRLVYADDPQKLAASLDVLAFAYQQLEDYPAALPLRQELVDLRIKLLGAEHWQVANARLDVQRMETLIGLDASQRQRLARATELTRNVLALFRAGKYDDALEPAREAVAIRKEVLGEADVDYAQSLNNLASLMYAMGGPVEAEPLFHEAARIRLDALGANHPDYRRTLDNLAELHLTLADNQVQQGELAAAAATWQEIVDLRTEQFGPDHWQVVDARLARQRIELQSKLDEKQREDLAAAGQLSQDVFRLFGEQKLDEAATAAQKIVDLRRSVLGDDHTDVADALVNLAVVYDRSGKPDEAAPRYDEAVDIYRRVLGPQHPRYAGFLLNLAASFEGAGNLARAEPLCREALTGYADALGVGQPEYNVAHDRLVNVLRRIALADLDRDDLAAAREVRQQVLQLQIDRFGADHWRSADARLDVERIDAIEHFTPEERQQLAEASTFMQDVVQLHRQGKFAQALEAARRALESRRAILGDDHLDTAEALNNLAAMYFGMGNHAAAEPLYQQALAIRQHVLGTQHPAYATSLNNLAELYRATGQYDRAEPLYNEALDISRRWSAESPGDYATSLNNLALLYHAQGRYVEAKPLYLEALQLSEQRVRDDPAAYAQSLNNLAGLYQEMGDVAQAEPLYLAAVDVRRQVLGEQHPMYATSLNNLALLYHAAEKYDQAEPLLRQAAEIAKQLDPPGKHPLYAAYLTDLAGLLHDAERFEEAGQLYQQALDIRREVLGPKHPDYAASLGNLAAHDRSVGRFDEAEPLYRESLDILMAELGDQHPVYGKMLRNLAKLYDSQGKAAQAEPFLRQSLEIAQRQLERTAAVQSERQQLAMALMFRGTLDAYLSLSTRTELPVEDTYRHVLRWKGAVFARQLRVRNERRILRATNDPALVRLLADLESTACRIATLALSVPPADEREARWRELGELTREKEHLEIELARLSGEFRQQQEVADLTPAQLSAQLPEGVVLADVLEYLHSAPPPDGKGKWPTERRLIVYVVRRGQPIERIELGPAAPIAEAVTLWRGTLKRKNPIVDASDPAIRLRDAVWLPIEKYLRPDDYVLVSPDGALARLPLVALPGREENTYLIEERTIGILPVPQMLPEMLAGDPDRGGDTSMLVVGDVDFDAGGEDAEAAGGNTRSASGLFGNWKELPETRTELVTVGDSFELKYPDGKLRKLRRDLASEENVRAAAPHNRWLHLATHGFFAPPEKHSALAPVEESARGGAGLTRDAAAVSGAGIGGFHPGVLSGVVLAGANHPHGDGTDDGVLTAMEVSEMDLGHVELVVLSACETGLGEVAGGEGVLGIQRAFQLAGADTVVTSLWTVDDLATQLLMVHFYDQLWQKSDHKLSKLEAFRQSQLMLLREGPKRGFTSDEEEKPQQPPLTPPFYWAAFSISGDWR